jgi:hypothetical protein
LPIPKIDVAKDDERKTEGKKEYIAPKWKRYEENCAPETCNLAFGNTAANNMVKNINKKVEK